MRLRALATLSVAEMLFLVRILNFIFVNLLQKSTLINGHYRMEDFHKIFFFLRLNHVFSSNHRRS